MRPYYEAYEERYRAIHAKGLRWAGEQPTPLVADVAARYCPEGASVLELGCGEGRDARAMLAQGYDLLATDVSPEAVAFCRRTMPEYAQRFRVLDCLRDAHPVRYDYKRKRGHCQTCPRIGAFFEISAGVAGVVPQFLYFSSSISFIKPASVKAAYCRISSSQAGSSMGGCPFSGKAAADRRISAHVIRKSIS